MSAERMKDVGDVIWDGLQAARNVEVPGPRVETVRHAVTAPGRNDACHCGAGRSSRSAAAEHERVFHTALIVTEH